MDSKDIRTLVMAKKVAGGSGGGGSSADFDALIDGSITQIKSNVTSIREGAFDFCTNITLLDMPNIVNLTRNGWSNSALTGVETVNFPNVTEADSGIFQGFTALKNVNLPKLTEIPTYAFRNCSALTELNLPSVSVIDSPTSLVSTTLKNLILPGITSLDIFNLKGTTALELLDIVNNPETPFSFGMSTSPGKANTLKRLIIRIPPNLDDDELPTLDSAFLEWTGFGKKNTSRGGNLYVPEEYIESFKYDLDVWPRFFSPSSSERDLGNENNQILPIEGSPYE